MNVDVNIDANEVNKLVSEAILKSAVGAQLKKAIEQEVNRLGNGYYDNPYKAVINNIIAEEIRKLINDKYKPLILEQVQKHMTEKFTEQLISKLWNAWLKEAELI